MKFLDYIEEQNILEFNNLILEKANVDIKETASKEANKMLKMSEKNFDKAGDAALVELIKFAKKHKLEKKILTSINQKTGQSYTSLEKMRKDLKPNDINEELDEGFKEFIVKGNAIKNSLLTMVAGVIASAVGNAITIGSIVLGTAVTTAAPVGAAGTIGGVATATAGAAAVGGGALLIFITIITRVILYIMKKINRK